MYEDVTYDIILKRMLTKSLQYDSNIDTREGSIIYNALAPAAVELQNMYIQLDTVLNESFGDTASRTYLIKRAAERGLSPSVATYAVLQGVFKDANGTLKDVDIGVRFSLNTLYYTITEKISTGTFKLKCETTGTGGNQTGMLIPVDYINGLASAKATDILVYAEDDETTEDFRARYLDSLSSQAFGGNIADYKENVNAIDGVGGVRVYPAYSGGGTVKLVIISSAYGVPSTTLVSTVKETIDPTLTTSTGMGIAPIGHTVTVAGVTETVVDIATTVTCKSTLKWADVSTAATASIDAYFLELCREWADSTDSSNIVIRLSQIDSRLLDVDGIVDVNGTKINSAAQNLTLGADCIPKRGSVSG